MYNLEMRIIHKYTHKVLSWSLGIWSLDTRSLALMRFLLGLYIIIDSLSRLSDLTIFYNNNGLTPLNYLLGHSGPETWSIFFISGSNLFNLLGFAVIIIAAIFLMLGYKTRLSLIVLWIMTVSLQARQPYILHASDIIVRMTLLFSIFLPVAKKFSFDLALKKTNAKPSILDQPMIIGLASMGMIVQQVLIYLMAAKAKFGPAWGNDATAVALILQNPVFASNFAHYLEPLKKLNQIGTRIIVRSQEFLPWLILTNTSYLRLLAVGGLIIFQLFIFFTMHIHLFTAISIIALIALLPAIFWDRLLFRIIPDRKEKIKIYYDNDCSFCHQSSLILPVMLLASNVEIISSQTNPAIAQYMFEQDSWVIVKGQQRYIKWEAFLILLGNSRIWFWTIPVFDNRFSKYCGEKIYAIIAKNRQKVCLPSSKHHSNSSNYASLSLFVLITTFLGLSILTVIDSSFMTSHSSTLNKIRLPGDFSTFRNIFRLDQSWNLFSPQPPNSYGWFVIPAKLENGEIVDLFSDQKAVSEAEPSNYAKHYRNYRWLKYLTSLSAGDALAQEQLELMAGYYCRNNPDILNLDIIYFQKTILLYEKPAATATKKKLWQHQCRAGAGYLNYQ